MSSMVINVVVRYENTYENVCTGSATGTVPRSSVRGGSEDMGSWGGERIIVILRNLT